MADIVFSVSQINEYISKKLYTDLFLSNVLVMGEVTNFSMSSTGHAFFSLKDDSGMLSCIVYDYHSNENTEAVKDGELIEAKGKVTYFKKSGSIQLAVSLAEPQGKGDLYVKFEQTKAKLIEEGIFDAIHKKPIPQFPLHIGVVTSAAGAAVHDIINVSTRRFDGVHISVYPSKVQGAGAATQICAGIDYFNEKGDVDVIIVGRGGGSFEDLFVFNEEIVARAVFDSQIPIVSAVGHETDFSLCDMAADLRAPTPSAAAELVVSDKSAVLQYVQDYKKQLFTTLKTMIDTSDSALKLLQGNVKSYPFNIKISGVSQKITSQKSMMKLYLTSSIEKFNLTLDKLSNSLTDLNPKGVLNRGYALVYDENGSIITSAKGNQQNMDIEFNDGRVAVTRKD
ncbi:MAG: exodeoxyribonuclease VII large subunit [Clostridia bacterium]|jgi:exodeoxyribonuclease VII large subunit|nr:exodeoxyribonuclease VII large subunit [Clostridia bacterium]MBT7123285.1 exodeoxyribonuclease VII large subunit [Clostridia bacterium]